jgi:preprotein translocase subunit SecG
MLTTVVQIVWLVAAVCLIVLVLLHSPKGDGLGALGGQAQLFTSTKSAETSLNRATWILTIIFMALAVVLSAGWLNEGAFAPGATELPGTPGGATTEIPVAPAPAAPAAPVPATTP